MFLRETELQNCRTAWRIVVAKTDAWHLRGTLKGNMDRMRYQTYSIRFYLSPASKGNGQ